MSLLLGGAGAAGGSVELGPTPTAPGSVAAMSAGFDAIEISWTDDGGEPEAVNEDAFEIERSLDGATGWVNIATTGQDPETLYQDSGLDAATTYYYRMRSTKVGSSPSDWSSVVNATTDSEEV